MGIKERFIRFFKRGRSTTAKGSNNRSRTSAVRSGGPAPWLYSTSPALCVSTAFRCVDLLSKSVANLPVACKKKSGKIFVEDSRGMLPYLLNVEPDAALNAFDFWRQVCIEVLCEGNAYIIPYYSTATSDWNRLALCGRGTVSHDINNDTYTVSDYTNGIYGTYHENQVIHIKGMTGINSKTGMSVLTYARLTMNIANAGDQEAFERFSTGGTVKGFLSVRQTPEGVNAFLHNNEEAAYDVARSIDRQQNEMDIIALPGEYDFKQFSLSSTDMQFLESRKFTVREICRFFGVHPSFVFDDTSNNYKSAEMANVAFLSNTLNPMLRQIENELLRKLFPPSLCLTRKIEFDRQGLYACDLDSRVKYLGSMISAGLYTVNEARILEGMRPVEGGDNVLVSANLKSIEELLSGRNPNNQTENGEEE